MSPVLKKFSVAENPSLLVTANFPNCLWGPRAKHFVRGGNYIWPQTCSAETFKDIGSTLIKLITNGAWLYHPGSIRTWEAVTVFAEEVDYKNFREICKNMGSVSIFATRMWNAVIKLIYFRNIAHLPKTRVARSTLFLRNWATFKLFPRVVFCFGVKRFVHWLEFLNRNSAEKCKFCQKLLTL